MPGIVTHPRVPCAAAHSPTAMAEASVDRALCICTTLEEFESVHALALGFDNFWCSAGVHPDNEDVREPSVEDLAALYAMVTPSAHDDMKPQSRPARPAATPVPAPARAAAMAPALQGLVSSTLIFGTL